MPTEIFKPYIYTDNVEECCRVVPSRDRRMCSESDQLVGFSSAVYSTVWLTHTSSPVFTLEVLALFILALFKPG